MDSRPSRIRWFLPKGGRIGQVVRLLYMARQTTQSEVRPNQREPPDTTLAARLRWVVLGASTMECPHCRGDRFPKEGHGRDGRQPRFEYTLCGFRRLRRPLPATR